MLDESISANDGITGGWSVKKYTHNDMIRDTDRKNRHNINSSWLEFGLYGTLPIDTVFNMHFACYKYKTNLTQNRKVELSQWFNILSEKPVNCVSSLANIND